MKRNIFQKSRGSLRRTVHGSNALDASACTDSRSSIRRLSAGAAVHEYGRQQQAHQHFRICGQIGLRDRRAAKQYERKLAL